MPNMDKTGPQGAGPKTGKQLGQCDGAMGNNCRRGFGRRCGLGNGQGQGRRFNRGL